MDPLKSIRISCPQLRVQKIQPPEYKVAMIEERAGRFIIQIPDSEQIFKQYCSFEDAMDEIRRTFGQPITRRPEARL